jgi:hypothetical protein
VTSRQLALAILVMLTVLMSALPADAAAIPAFARRYRVSCQLCHNPFPQLTAFGNQFAANGYRMAAREEPRDTISTGDELLSLMREIPLAVRLDLYAQHYANGNSATDFQTPYTLKLFSAGTISKSISYFFYALLLDEGEMAGVEDAFVHLNDLGGAPIDLVLGQFEVSDPVFKRESRLEFEDYAIYRARVGDVPVDLTYDRGFLATADLAGFTVTGEIMNGNGIGSPQPNRRFDVDASKNVFLHVTRNFGNPVRVGAFGFHGHSHGNGVTNRTRMLGLDGTFSSGALTLNGQFVHREDNQPTFAAGEPAVKTNGGFAELLVRPPGSRFYGYGLYNLVDTDRPLLDVREGGPPGLSRYQSLTGGLGYLMRRNVRVSGEISYDLEADLGRITAGLSLAF